MRKILLNILDLAPQNVSILVLLVAGGVWLGVWYILICDVLGRSRPVWWKLFWLIITAIPIAGGILYSLAELLGADWRAAFSLRQHDARTKPEKADAKPRAQRVRVV